MKIKLLLLCLLLTATVLGQKKPVNISIHHLTSNFYVCVSYGYPPGSDTPFPANSLFAVTPKGIVLVNTPWGEEQTRQLVDSVKRRFHKKIIFCAATHFHDDCVGGFNILKEQGAATYASRLTYALAKKENNELPQFNFTKDTTFNIGGVILKTYYPGQGHTRDNIVIWLPQGKILFGGCLVKSLDTESKGFTGDANLKQWPASIKNVQSRFTDAVYVIPGHQGWQGGKRQLAHTIKVVSR